MRVGVDYGEDPPVPIPNTEVKLISADDTWLATARENRYSPTQKQLGTGNKTGSQLFFYSKLRKNVLLLHIIVYKGEIICIV